MTTVFSFQEADVYVWTGDIEPNTPLLYAQDIALTIVRQWENLQTVNCGHQNVLRNTRADLTVTTHLSQIDTLWPLFNDDAVTHMHLNTQADGTSAGFYLWSGRMPSYNLGGSRGGPLLQTIAYYSNDWSAYGG